MPPTGPTAVDLITKLGDVVITDELVSRPSRAPDYELEQQATSVLIEELATSPTTMLQRLCDLLVELRIAQTAGVSLHEAEDHQFRWVAVAGEWAPHLDGVMPFGGSPCGAVVRRDEPMLFSRPHEHFPAANVEPLIREILLVPIRSGGKPVGTLWVMAHDEEKKFDCEDLRLLTSVAQLASVAHQTTQTLAETEARGEEKFRTLFDSIDEGLAIVEMIHDERGEIVEMIFRQVNAAYERQGGIHDVVGRSVSEMLPDVEEVWLDRYRQVAVTGEPLRVQDYQQDRDRWFDVYFSRLDKTGRFVAIVFRDISERKRAEANAALLAAVADDLTRLVTPDDIIQAVGARVGKALQIDLCTFADVDHERDEVAVHHAWQRHGLLDFARRTFPLADYLSDEFQRAQRAGETLIVNDTASDARTNAEAYARLSVRAFLAVPFIVGGRWQATLSVIASKPRHWRDDEIKVVKGVVDRVFPRIERVRAEAALRQSEEALAADLANTERLRTLSERLVSEESFDALYDEILSTTVAIAQADAGTIQIYDPATKALELIASLNFSRTITDYFYRVDAGSRTACGVALKTGERAFVDFPDEGADYSCQLLVGEGIQSALALPLVSRTGTPLGMLNAHWRKPRHRPSDGELRYLHLLARQAADLIEQRRAQKALRDSEERLREFGQASQDILWMRDAATLQWTYLTPAFERVFGLSREEALEGDNYRSWLELIVPEDRERIEGEIGKVRAGNHVCFEYRIIRPSDGTIRWLMNTDFPIRDASGSVVGIGGVGTDITDRKRNEERQKTLLAELQHRVRNVLAMMRSVVRRSSQTKTHLTDFVEHLEGRIEAMARTQALLTRAPGKFIPLEDLVRDEMLAQSAADGKFALYGPPALLPPHAAEVLTLALHELATNSVKYGALGQKDGRITINWECEGDEKEPRLHVVWHETGLKGASFGEGGFGTELITRRVPYELKGRGEMVFSETSLTTTIEFPLEQGSSILETNPMPWKGASNESKPST